jgi:hypothetical protein
MELNQMVKNGVAGVAGLPQANDFNGCDSFVPENKPAKTAGNPAECRTLRPPRPAPIYQLDCKARRTKDGTDRMRIDLTKKMAEAVLIDLNDAVVPFLRRQMTEVMK